MERRMLPTPLKDAHDPDPVHIRINRRANSVKILISGSVDLDLELDLTVQELSALVATGAGPSRRKQAGRHPGHSSQLDQLIAQGRAADSLSQPENQPDGNSQRKREN